MNPDLSHRLAVARRADAAAGDYLLKALWDDHTVTAQGAYDVHLAADAEASRLIRNVLAPEFPGEFVLEEDGEADPGTGEWVWIVDPLDGTVNYFHRLPWFCVSIACYHRTGASDHPLWGHGRRRPRGVPEFCRPLGGGSPVRFVIITLPPPGIQGQIEAIRRPLNVKTGSAQALRYPPHITLRTGLVCPDDQAGVVADAFLAHAAGFHAVEASTQGLFFTTYGPADAPRGMVGWSVVPSPDLVALHRGLFAFSPWQKGPQGAFQPHLTLAFDDLAPCGVEVIRQSLEASGPVPDFAWTVDRVCLYHELPQGWVEWASVSLKSSSSPSA
jgi:2'-5' RNA ligase